MQTLIQECDQMSPESTGMSHDGFVWSLNWWGKDEPLRKCRSSQSVETDGICSGSRTYNLMDKARSFLLMMKLYGEERENESSLYGKTMIWNKLLPRHTGEVGKRFRTAELNPTEDVFRWMRWRRKGRTMQKTDWKTLWLKSGKAKPMKNLNIRWTLWLLGLMQVLRATDTQTNIRYFAH